MRVGNGQLRRLQSRQLLEAGDRFYSTPRCTQDTTYVDGAGAVLMAFLFFALAAIGTAVIMNRLNAPRAVRVVMSAAIPGSPAAYLVVSAFG